MKIGHLLAAVAGMALGSIAGAQDSVSRGSQGLSNASGASLAASSFVVAGSAQLIQGSTQLVVAGLETVGESTVVVLRGASEGVTVSVQMSAQLAREASIAAGNSVRVVAESIGHALYVGARLIAFIPNEIGRALIHHSRHGAQPPR